MFSHNGALNHDLENASTYILFTMVDQVCQVAVPEAKFDVYDSLVGVCHVSEGVSMRMCMPRCDSKHA